MKLNLEDYDGIIYSIINKSFKNYQNKEDLYQAGYIGLINAANNYKPGFNCKFSTYAFPWIFGEMSELVRLDHNIRPTRTASAIRTKIERAYALLSQKMMRQPTYQEIAEYLEIPEYLIMNALNLSATSSFDDVVGDDITLEDMIGNCDDIDSLLILKDSLNSLEKEEKQIIISRYINGYTQSETSSIIGTSQAQISRKEKKASEKIKLKVVA